MASKVSRGIALPFLDRGIRKGWVVNSTPQPHFTPGKGPVPIVQEAGWAPGPVWTGGKSRPTGIRSPDRPARNQSLYRLSYLELLLLWERIKKETITDCGSKTWFEVVWIIEAFRITSEPLRIKPEDTDSPRLRVGNHCHIASNERIINE
jgi:hypothetical protein